MKLNLLLFTVLLVIAYSCNNGKSDEEELKKESIEDCSAEKESDYYDSEKVGEIEKKSDDSAEDVETDKRSTSKLAFSPQDFKDILFFGTEPFWSLMLYDDYAIKKELMQDSIKYYYVVNGSVENNKLKDAIKPKSGISVTIEVTDENQTAIGIITITHRNCNDGMSDYIYPYTFSFIIKDGREFYGCGRII